MLQVSYDLPRVSICVPSLGNYKGLNDLFLSLKAHTSHIDYEVVVIDSASRIRGFVGPMNQAFDAARGDILIGINDDVIVTPGWIDPLLAEIEKGTWVCFPDQRSTDGNQVLCGWCVVFSREAYTTLNGYDDRFNMWCSDIDLARRLIEMDKRPVRVAIPTPLIHTDGGTNTVGNQEIRDYTVPTGQSDIIKYTAKWNSDPNVDKFELYE